MDARDAVMECFESHPGESLTLREIRDWVGGKYPGRWTDIGTTVSDLVVNGNSSSSYRLRGEQFLERVGRGTYRVIQGVLPQADATNRSHHSPPSRPSNSPSTGSHVSSMNRQGTSQPLMSRKEINSLIDTCVHADLAEPERRSLLLSGLPKALSTQLPTYRRPQDQVTSDINALVAIPTADEIDETPLLIWMENAHRLALVPSDRDSIKKLLAIARRRATGE